MPIKLIPTGQKFGMLTVVNMDGKTPAGQYKYRCVCDCGGFSWTSGGHLRSGRSTSCGCKKFRKGKDNPNYKHGITYKRGTDEYRKYQRECFDRTKYALEPGHKQAMLDAQNNSCAICGYKFGQKQSDAHVDHDHKTGKVRGLLCDLCNRGIGMLRENLDTLANAIAYLKKHSG